jgi:hypothetical protein
MSLEQLYNDAQSGTYVGKVKSTQVSDVGAGPADSSFDGGRKTTRTIASSDVFQKEFTRNAAGAYVVGGAQGTVPPSNDKTYQYSRWTGEALKLPFEGKGPASLDKGFYDNNRFRTATTPKGPTTVHNYTPNDGKGYVDTNASARARYNSTSTSPIGGGGTTGGSGGTNGSKGAGKR